MYTRQVYVTDVSRVNETRGLSSLFIAVGGDFNDIAVKVCNHEGVPRLVISIEVVIHWRTL